MRETKVSVHSPIRTGERGCCYSWFLFLTPKLSSPPSPHGISSSPFSEDASAVSFKTNCQRVSTGRKEGNTLKAQGKEGKDPKNAFFFFSRGMTRVASAALEGVARKGTLGARGAAFYHSILVSLRPVSVESRSSRWEKKMFLGRGKT